MKNRIQQILFNHCVVHKWQNGWNVFSIEPQNNKGYIFLIKRGREKRSPRSFICTPTYTKEHRKENELNVLSLVGAIKLAWDYDKFCDNSEYF